MLSNFPASFLNPQRMHSLHISLNILITLKMTLPLHFVLFLHPFMLTCGQLNYTRFKNAAPNFWSGGSDTIARSEGSSSIHSFISIFVLFIFIKNCWILFKSANSACCFYRDIITRRVAPYLAQRGLYTLIEGCFSRTRSPTWYLSSPRGIHISKKLPYFINGKFVSKFRIKANLSNTFFTSI